MLTKQTDIIGKNFKEGVQQSTLCCNLNLFKNKQICNEETQKGTETKHSSKKRTRPLKNTKHNHSTTTQPLDV